MDSKEQNEGVDRTEFRFVRERAPRKGSPWLMWAGVTVGLFGIGVALAIHYGII